MKAGATWNRGGLVAERGLMTRALSSGGLERLYSVYTPERSTEGRRWSVVIDIHGTGSDPDEELAISGMARAAEERGFLVILPIARIPHAAGGFGWNVPRTDGEGDDVAYIRDVLGDVERSSNIDPARIFVTGFSGGARLASEVAAGLSNRIAALGAVSGLRAPTLSGRAVPVIAFHGTRDPVNPFEGGGPEYWQYGVSEALEAWATRNGNPAGTETRRVAEGTHVVRRIDRDGPGELLLHVLDGVGHVWPGSEFEFPSDRFGKMTGIVNATSLMLDFFARHPHQGVQEESES